jgi:hypothetical protein
LGSGEGQLVGRQEKGCESRLRVSPLGGGDGAGAISLAAAGVADYQLTGFWRQGILAVVKSLAKAAGMRSRGGRQRDRGEAAHEREQEQEFGGKAMHAEVVGSLPTYRCRKQHSRRQNIWPLLVMSTTATKKWIP